MITSTIITDCSVPLVNIKRTYIQELESISNPRLGSGLLLTPSIYILTEIVAKLTGSTIRAINCVQHPRDSDEQFSESH